MIKKLCAALLCLLMVAGLWGCGERHSEEPFEEVFTETITKIDLSAPENQNYYDWLVEFYAQRGQHIQREFPPSSTESKADKPDINASEKARNEWVKYSLAQEKPAEEQWKTWDWNEIWELEQYRYEKDVLLWDVLRARNKTNGETQFIDELFYSNHDIPGYIEVLHIGDEYIVYGSGEMGTMYTYFYTLEQNEKQYIGDGEMAGFFDNDPTKWWHRSKGTEDQLHYIDLRKKAAGDADAESEVFVGRNFWCRGAWMAERGGRSMACFLSYGANVVVYDPSEDRIEIELEVPQVGNPMIAAVLPDRCYYFDDTMYGWSRLDFYVINLDI